MIEEIKIIAELGSIGIVLVLIFKSIPMILNNAKEDRDKFLKIITNHLSHNEKSQNKQANSMDNLAKSVDKLLEKLNKE